jgi:hypothetical protein
VIFNRTGDTTGQPTWNRPIAGVPPTSLSGVGTAVRYDVLSFNVDIAGSYLFNGTSTYDNYGFLYQGAFDPAAQFTNVIIGNDDDGSSLDYGFTTTLNTVQRRLSLTDRIKPL